MVIWWVGGVYQSIIMINITVVRPCIVILRGVVQMGVVQVGVVHVGVVGLHQRPVSFQSSFSAKGSVQGHHDAKLKQLQRDR